MWPGPVTLDGTNVRLEPLSHSHAEALRDAVADGELHALWYTQVPAPDGVADEIDRRLALQSEGRMLPFAVLERGTGQPVGITTYMNVDSGNRRLEIGSTFYRKSAQRTGINTEAKLLLLGHAFDELDCVAVEFRTHILNHQSRRAIERLGARLDGILRNHMIMPNGTLRDTAVYSIIPGEWPTVKAHLEARLAHYAKPE